MPWLITTALIHSLITCEQKSMFKNWTILLSIMAFSLSLLGTFLVRSGILISVHSFANDPARGAFILLFLTIVVGGSLLIYFKNSPKIKDNISFDFFSRESFFLINNILLVTATFTILLGTMYPLLLDLLGLEKISVGVPYYNAVFLPIMTPLALLAGYIPILFLSKRKDKKYMLNHLLASLLVVIFLSLLSIAFFDNFNLNVLLGIFIFIWISFNIIYDLINRYYLSKTKNIFFTNIGMTLAHLGLAVFILGATIVENNKVEKEIVVKIGETIEIKNYAFKFKSISEYDGPNYLGVKAKFLVYENNNLITELYPEKRIYASNNNMPMTEAGIDPGLSRDLYITLGSLINDDVWSVRIYHKPFIRLIWLGALMMVFGGVLSVLSKRKSKPVALSG